jgi:hypothetical protein
MAFVHYVQALELIRKRGVSEDSARLVARSSSGGELREPEEGLVVSCPRCGVVHAYPLPPQVAAELSSRHQAAHEAEDEALGQEAAAGETPEEVRACAICATPVGRFGQRGWRHLWSLEARDGCLEAEPGEVALPGSGEEASQGAPAPPSRSAA